MSNPFDWSFLNEPLWRWFIFFIAMCCFAGVWGTLLSHMKAA